MASSSSTLSESEISKVTDIISADNRLRFSVEYLGINGNEYKTIEADAKFMHHDTLYECLRRWKNRTEAAGKTPKDELVRILTEIRQERGWFPFDVMAFLTDVTGLELSPSRITKVQEWIKESLRKRLQKSLSHDWIHEKTSHKFPLRQYYVELQWNKKIRTAMGSQNVTLTSIHELIKQLGVGRQDQAKQSAATSHKTNHTSVLIEGEGGIGKTSSLGILALDWAENMRPELQQYQFVFLVLLRYVEGNEPLETIIMQQHGRLETENVSRSEVKAIIQGETNGNILLMFDGYDEYSKGSNEDIDKIILNGKDNCLVIVSSRSGDFLHPVKSQIDEEVKISGFSYDNILKCAEQYLGSEILCQEFLLQAEKAGIHTCSKPTLMPLYKGLLHVPIILLMACTVFIENKCLPSNRTGLFKQVVLMSISRTTLKTMGKTAIEVDNLHELMVRLGKLAWDALTRTNKQLILYKKDVVAESPEILKLGLLFGEDVDATTKELPELLSFQHKLIQEYLAGVYIAENAKIDASFLTDAFQAWKNIKAHREVMLFACGILAESDDAHLLTDHVAKMLSEHIQINIDDGINLSCMFNKSPELDLFESFQEEGNVSTLNPYITQYPRCGRPLGEILSKTQTVVINHLDMNTKNDILHLSSSTANIIIVPKCTSLPLEQDREQQADIFHKLITALGSIKANVITIDNTNLPHLNVESILTQLRHFPQLRDLSMTNNKKEDLTKRVESWGLGAQLRSCQLVRVPLPRSAIDALSKCTYLKYLFICGSDLKSKLSTFMASPPPALGVLMLYDCSLEGADVDNISQAMREDKLPHLQILEAQCNPVGETAVNSLLEAIVTRPHRKMILDLTMTGLGKDGVCSALSESFVKGWLEKLAGTKIKIHLILN